MFLQDLVTDSDVAIDQGTQNRHCAMNDDRRQDQVNQEVCGKGQFMAKRRIIAVALIKMDVQIKTTLTLWINRKT